MEHSKYNHELKNEKTLEEIIINNGTLNKKNILELVRIKNIWQLINLSEWLEIEWVDNTKVINEDTQIAASFILKQIKDILLENPEYCKNNSIEKTVYRIWDKLNKSLEVKDRLIWLYIKNIALKVSNVNLRYQRFKKHHEAIKDPLTWLNNRRNINHELSKIIKNKKRTWKNTSVLLIDIDFFKAINDKYWHDIWDKTLEEISKILKVEFRSTDTIWRWWWEEFMILLPETNLDVAVQKANNLKNIVAKKLTKNIDEIDWNITISIWVSETKSWDSNYNNIVKRADDALYVAKDSWRNIVCKEIIDNSLKEKIEVN